MRLLIDTGSVKFAAAGPAEPVLDYETRAPKLDENGTALFAASLTTESERNKEISAA
jgi:hypothetical protein